MFGSDYLKKCRLLVGSLLIVSMIALSVSAAARPERAVGGSYEEKLQAAQDNLDALEEKKKEASKLLESLKAEKESIEAYITELDIQMNDLSLQLFELEQEIESTEAELEITKQDLEEAKKKEQTQYDTMKKRIRYMYENSDGSMLEAILSAGDITDILNQMEYMYRITDYDNSLLDRYIEAKNAVIEKEAYLEASLEELSSLKETKEFEQETLAALVEAKNKEIEEYTEKIGITDETLFAYITEISNQEMEIEEIKEAERKRIEELERQRREEEERRRREQDAGRDDQTSVPSTPGYDSSAINNVVLTDETSEDKFIWPLPGDYRIYSRFGPRVAPIAGASTYHKGWDIGGEFGAPVVSVLAGKVTIASYSSSAGNYVRVDHGNGLTTSYCHFSKILVSVGDYVQQGQKIGLVGSTGVSTAPHLHFAVLRNGTYVDPQPYMPYK